MHTSHCHNALSAFTYYLLTSWYFKDENILFSGDFIFKDSIGRTDLGGNDLEMFDSINRIKKYDRNIIIKPGHGDDTTLCHEIDYNPFFN